MPRHSKGSKWLPSSASPCSVPAWVLLPQHVDACQAICPVGRSPGSYSVSQTWHKEQGTPNCLFCLGNPSPRARVRAKCDSPRGRYLWRDARAVSLRAVGETPHRPFAGSKDPGSPPGRLRPHHPPSSFPLRSLGLGTCWLEPLTPGGQRATPSGPPT